MHKVIKQMLAGQDIREPHWFTGNEDLKSYEPFIPALCELLRAPQMRFEGISLGMILLHIMPVNPSPAILTKLLDQLPGNKENGNVILKLLSRYRIPQEVDITPVLNLIGDPYFSTTAIFALSNSYHPAVEPLVLPLMREELSANLSVMQIYCKTLGNNGSILSIPVLMASSLDFESLPDKQIFIDAVAAISHRIQLPETIKRQFSAPAFWKLTWGGSAEQFVGFIEFLSIFMTNGKADEAGSIQRLAEIFMKEMEVDLYPYASFVAAKVCSPADVMQKGMESMKDSLECQALLAAVTEGTNILPSTYTAAKDLYFDLMNDYLLTRLRRHIAFASE